jgi:predicted MFS family arabinose efflux permease
VTDISTRLASDGDLDVLRDVPLTSAALAIGVMVVFGATPSSGGPCPHRAAMGVPQEFQGRVTGVYLVALFLGVIVGQALGGPIAQRWGLTAPFWFAFAGSAITLAPVRRQLPHIAHSDATAGR